MKVVLNLNDDVKKLLPKVDHLFLFDDDENSILMDSIIFDPKNPGANIKRVTGLKTLGNHLCAQISVYEMPNGKCCAVAYPSSVKVDWDKFNKEMFKLFEENLKDGYNNHSANTYAFYLYCIKNGYNSKIKDENYIVRT